MSSTPPTPAPAPLIYINAFPGTGKFTTARTLVSLLTNSFLLDNHTLIDPVAARFSRDHPEYRHERKLERDRAFKKYIEGEEWAGSVVVCTDFRATGDAIAGEYQMAAKRAGRLFVPVCLECGVEENLKRVVSDERKCGGTTKLVDPEEVTKFRGMYELHRFGGDEELVIDVTELPSEVVALVIFDWMTKAGGANHNTKRS
jgi:hypothetical protein